MSETTEHPEGAAAPPETQPGTSATPAESTPAPDADAPEQTEEQRQQQARDKGDRRFAALTAKLSAAEREQARQSAELEFYRRQAQAQPQAEETPEQRHQRERASIRAEVEAQIRAETFHQQGASAYADWKQRCDDVYKMGADAGFAQLLVEMPDGFRVTAALAEDPEAVTRIRDLPTERARAIALGKYAATLDDAPATRTASATSVTRAPAPIRPVTGRANPTFDEYRADGQTLVDRYMKADLEKRIRR